MAAKLTEPGHLEFKAAPPPSGGGRGGQPLPDSTVRALRRNAGKWAIVGHGPSSSTASAWRKAMHKKGYTDLELVGRTRPGRDGYDIWATSNHDLTGGRP